MSRRKEAEQEKIFRTAAAQREALERSVASRVARLPRMLPSRTSADRFESKPEKGEMRKASKWAIAKPCGFLHVVGTSVMRMPSA